jgi:uncharacterized protein
MEQETHKTLDPHPPVQSDIPPEAADGPTPADLTPVVPPEAERGIRWVFVGPQGLRAGWSALIFIAVMVVLEAGIFFAIAKIHPHKPGPMTEFNPVPMLLNEAVQLLVIVIAAFVVALIERRHLLEYNLQGPRRPQHFVGGLFAGFAALSLLVGILAAGDWIHFNGLALSGSAIIRYAVLWGIVFILVGCAEEGTFRCFLQFTLTRGINFWWALALVAAMCADLVARARGNGVWGVYAMAILGFFPCLALYLKAAPRSGFWYAAWVTSTLFGFVHTGNGGENPIGIFQAALVGVVFCVSIRVTGSALWAIGAHAGWDWGQSYFYGTPDSGFLARGHLLHSSIAGNVLFSGGADGPEGSVFGIGVLLLLLIFVVAVYGRRSALHSRDAELAPQ